METPLESLLVIIVGAYGGFVKVHMDNDINEKSNISMSCKNDKQMMKIAKWIWFHGDCYSLMLNLVKLCNVEIRFISNELSMASKET